MDDDNYVNARALLKLLRTLPQALDVYIGRPSLNRPIHASEPQPHNRTVGRSCLDSLGRGPARAGRVWGWAGPGLRRSLWVLWVSDLASRLCVWAGGLASGPQSPLWKGRLR